MIHVLYSQDHDRLSARYRGGLMPSCPRTDLISRSLLNHDQRIIKTGHFRIRYPTIFGGSNP